MPPPPYRPPIACHCGAVKPLMKVRGAWYCYDHAPLSLKATCHGCRREIVLASGYVATTADTATWLANLRAAGWSAVPRILCPQCQDKRNLREIFRRVDEGGNDGADIYEAESTISYLAEKYGITRAEVCSWADDA